MKCLHCGKESRHLLCGSCQTAPILDKIFHEIYSFKPDECENAYLSEYASEFVDPFDVKKCIPEILDLFDFEISEYYYCRYFKGSKDPRFENAAIAYLDVHEFIEQKSQDVLYDLLSTYIRNDFIKPQKWCEKILHYDELNYRLYLQAAQFYGMIGEYDLSDQCANKGLMCCADPKYSGFLIVSREDAIHNLNKQKEDTSRYRTKKPYWPRTEERRRAVAMFYDQKGISYPRITAKPEKVPQDQFHNIQEYYGEPLDAYCTFWCNEAYSIVNAKSIYEIAAVKVQNRKIIHRFQSLIRPWDGCAVRKDAAKKAGISLEEMESAEDVDLVISKFFDFIGDDILISVEALGNQAQLLSRAARYTGMKEIPNQICDIVDIVTDTCPDFDMTQVNRKDIMSHFHIQSDESALSIAEANYTLYEKLKGYEND